METGHGIKYRQLHIEDYLQEIPAEQGKVAGVYAHEWITGNAGTNMSLSSKCGKGNINPIQSDGWKYPKKRKAN